MTIAMTGEGIFLLTYPFQTHVYFFYGAEIVNNFFGAIIDVAMIAWMLDLWPEKANTFQLIMAAAGAVGATVSPFLVTPFLSVKEKVTPGNVTNVSTNGTTVPTFRLVKESMIVIPYSITASVHLFAAFFILAVFLASPYKKQERSVQNADITHQRNSNFKSRENSSKTLIIIAGIIMFILVQNTENNCLNYLPQFLAAVVPNISKQSAALMGSTYFAAYALTFGITIFVSTKVRVIHMLYAYYVLILAGNLLLAFHAKTSEVMTWMAVIILGAGHSSMTSGIYSFLEQRINVSDRIVGIMIAAATFTMMLNTLVFGQLVDSHPFAFVDANLICISISFIVLLVFTFSRLLN